MPPLDQAETVTPPADLAAIAAAADAELAGQSVIPGQEPAPEPDRGAELGAMLQLGVAMAAPALPFLPVAYTPEVCAQIGTAFAAVADKHGWSLNFTNSPELALAAVSVPPTITAIVLGRQYFADKAAKAAAAKAASTPRDPRREVMQPGAAWTDPGPTDTRPHAGDRIT